jgi:hypothetical protein
MNYRPNTSEIAKRQANLDVVYYLRRLRSWTPQGRRSGFAKHHLRMRLPSAIFVLDDGREVLVDRRHRPILERHPGHAVGVPASINKDEMWARSQSETYLDGPVNRTFEPTEDEWLVARQTARVA